MPTMPLFPLNAVLFPGTPISLYIFEERYKQMMRECIEQEIPFGVVLLQQGNEVSAGPARIHSIGCSAQITLVRRLNEGRMNVVAVGQERIRVGQLTYDRPYLVGDVESFPLPLDGPNRVELSLRHLRPWVGRYVQLLRTFSEEDVDLDVDRFPDDPLVYSSLVAYLLQIDPREKQPLLESATLGLLLDRSRRLYRREVSLMQAMLDRNLPEQAEAFSAN